MMHSDDKGLVLPPKIAPVHVVIVPIAKSGDEAIISKAHDIAKHLTGLSVEVDSRDTMRAGEKFYEWEKRNQLAVHLSYGQRKLLEIARTLVTKADIYLFDEPFAGLFPEMRKVISRIIKELKQENKTVIIVEHDIDLIRELCTQVFVMDEGKLLAEGKPEKVLKRKEVIEAYLGK